MDTSKLAKATTCDSMAALPHPPYSPDLAICDYFLFPKDTTHIRCRVFESQYELSIAMTEALKMTSRDGLRHAFYTCMCLCNKCILCSRIY